MTSRTKSLYLWLDTVLEREDMQSGAFVEDDVVLPPSPSTDDEEICDEEIDDDSSSFPKPESPSLPAPVRMVPMDRETRARWFVARLRQPFGALLVTPASTGRRAVDYRWVVSLADLLNNVRTLDILRLA